MVHCCVINNYFDPLSCGAFNAIGKIDRASNVTFWQDWFWGLYYSASAKATLGLNQVENSLVTVHQVQVNVMGAFRASASSDWR